MYLNSTVSTFLKLSASVVISKTFSLPRVHGSRRNKFFFNLVISYDRKYVTSRKERTFECRKTEISSFKIVSYIFFKIFVNLHVLCVCVRLCVCVCTYNTIFNTMNFVSFLSYKKKKERRSRFYLSLRFSLSLSVSPFSSR